MPETFDLIVVGAGATGLTAAVDAADAGLSVLLVEASADYGGAARISGGGSWLADTPLQRRLGLEDGVERALTDWLALGGEEVDPGWARRYLQDGRDAVYGWLEGHGVEWSVVYPTEGASVARWHAPAGGGAALTACLWAAATRLGVVFRPATAVAALTVSDGAVTGIETASGERLAARAVLVATGGFAGSAAVVDAVLGPLGDGSPLYVAGAPGATGAGHELVTAAGGEVARLDRVCIYPYATPDDLDPAGRRAIVVRGAEDGEIWVGDDGRRFHDESRRSDRTGTPALLAQRPVGCWAVFDRRAAGNLVLSDVRFREEDGDHRAQVEAFLERSPHIHRADTIAGLAQAAGLPSDALEATVAEVNAAAARGEVDRFGRDLAALKPIERAPFFAMRFVPVVRKCLGGVQTDEHGRVRRAGGGLLRGCYAAGEVAGAAGGAINGTAEVAMLGPSVFSGRVAVAAIRRDIAGAPAPVGPRGRT